MLCHAILWLQPGLHLPSLLLKPAQMSYLPVQGWAAPWGRMYLPAVLKWSEVMEGGVAPSFILLPSGLASTRPA